MSKKKKKHTKTYPRRNDTTYKQPIIVSKPRGLVVHIENGEISLKDRFGVPYPVTSFDSATTYTGAHKTRVVTKAFDLTSGNVSVGAWTKNFDVVYAADTNTKPIHDGMHNFSIGHVTKGTITKNHDNGGIITLTPYAVFAWIWSGDKKIEQETWVKAIQKIQAEESDSCRIGFIVDSDLGNIDSYSNRSLPLLRDFFLPDNFSLIYASADHADEWTNQMIKRCDHYAGIDLDNNLPNVEALDSNTPLQDGILFCDLKPS